jgi:hypothetical protein
MVRLIVLQRIVQFQPSRFRRAANDRGGFAVPLGANDNPVSGPVPA